MFVVLFLTRPEVPGGQVPDLLLIPSRDRLVELSMLGGDEVEVIVLAELPAHPRIEQLADLNQELIARELGDDGVEVCGLTVGADDIADLRHLLPLLHRRFELRQPIAIVSLGSEFEGQDVEDRPHLIEIGDVAGGECSHSRPRIGSVRDETFRGKQFERLTDRHAADAELRGEIPLHEFAARLPHTVDDLIAQDLGDPHGL